MFEINHGVKIVDKELFLITIIQTQCIWMGCFFDNWIKWLLLSIIIIGIYIFWVGIKLEDWKAKNTSFVN